ncbi:ABC transporter permease [Streptomyces sp. A0958]|uniref:ABC transporter permease n=1 Tax=Streptomyces sp. A0958 TaxID=2563101 RepID=UPI001F0DFC02|nr:ABC transporter permease [Streptomyces sp. A0958]
MGIWSSALFGSGGAVQNQRWLGTLETLVASPTSLSLVLLPITLATAVIGTYAMGATVIWGAVLFDVPLDCAHPVLCLVAVPVCVLSLGMTGLLLAATFVLLRNANALANPLDAPVWLLSGMLVPVTVLPDWTRPISWALPTTGAPARCTRRPPAAREPVRCWSPWAWPSRSARCTRCSPSSFWGGSNSVRGPPRPSPWPDTRPEYLEVQSGPARSHPRSCPHARPYTAHGAPPHTPDHAPSLYRRIVSAWRLVVIGGALSYRALFNWTTPPMFIGTLLVGPLLQLLFFVFLGRQLQIADDQFYLLGNAVISASTACVYGGTMAVANERPYGTLGAVLLSPRNRAPLWFGRALPYVLNGLVISVFTLSAACLLLGLRIPVAALPGLGAVLLAAAAGCSAFGLALGALGALGLRFRDVFLVSNVASSVLLLLTGANVPRQTLPGWMRALGDVLPLTHAADAARQLSAGAGFDGRGVAAELATGTGNALLAVVLLAVFERGSRRRATLDVM